MQTDSITKAGWIVTKRSVESMSGNIIDATAKHFGVKRTDILSDVQNKELRRARKVAMYLVRSVQKLSFPRIAQIFHRDHSTIVQAVQSVEENAELVSEAVEIRRFMEGIADPLDDMVNRRRQMMVEWATKQDALATKREELKLAEAEFDAIDRELTKLSAKIKSALDEHEKGREKTS